MKVSIIIPVYNKEQYLRPCLTSALSQDFEDYEVIAVDDGSTDSSGRICDEKASKDSRLRVIHTENAGVTAARRRGMEDAKGEFVMFCDSDDQLLPHAIRNSYEAIIANNADEVIAPYQNQHGKIYNTGQRGFIKAEEIIQDFLAVRNSFPSNWAILFKRSLLDGCLDIPREIINGEDILFHIRVLMKLPKVYCIAESNYIYHQGLPNNREITLQHQIAYDKILRDTLQPLWSEMKLSFLLFQLKWYEWFLDKKQFHVFNEYYRPLRKQLSKDIPLKERITILLPPRISYFLVHGYKKWLSLKRTYC